MNWYGIYKKLIERARTRERPSGCDLESHHVLPRSEGGTDSLDNLVALTVHEHYIAHRIYDRMTGHRTASIMSKIPGRKWVAMKLALKARSAEDKAIVKEAREFLGHFSSKILESPDLVTKFIPWGEIFSEALRFKVSGTVDIDMAKRLSRLHSLMSMEYHCGRKGFLERNGGRYSEIYDLLGNYT